jgi:hypothetical protein
MKIQSAISNKIRFSKTPLPSKELVFKLFLLFCVTGIFFIYGLFLIYYGGKLQKAEPGKLQNIYRITSNMIVSQLETQQTLIIGLFDSTPKKDPGKQIQIRIDPNDSKQNIIPAEPNYKSGKLNNSQVTQTAFNRSELSPLTQPANIQKVDFFKIDEQKKQIYIESGDYKITENIVIPKGYTVILESGVHIQMENSSSFISFSPLRFIGSKKDPIKIFSEDLTGQGIVVIKASSTSILKYVHFKNLTNPNQNGWNITGAVTFYESDVDISNCKFDQNKAEDALNIVRSKFLIEHTKFGNAFSDAFDSDFSTGKILHSSFLDSKNDGIDVSGSQVELKNILVDGSGDKAISAGENSLIKIENLKINNVVIGIASKDLSKVNVKHADISNAKIAFAAYQKKSEFGPGFIKAQFSIVKDTEITAFAENGSTILYNGTSFQNSKGSLKRLLP